MDPVLSANFKGEKPATIDQYNDGKGWTAFRKAVMEMKPEQVIEEMKASGLRGRGGAGFNTGTKWSFIPKDYPGPRYLACNADESEPGAFKDRQLIEHDPHMILEGMAIGSYAIGAKKAYIYIRGEFVYGAKCLQSAVDEAYAKGVIGKKVFGSGYDIDMAVVRGGGAYICGEETSLLSSIEGNRGYPKVRPPFPANPGGGLHGEPTIVNNVETLSCAPHILNRGAAWFKAIGPEKSPGVKLFGASGHVNNPGVFEGPMGTPLMTIINDWAGGVWKGRKLKGVIPGGTSCPIITADEARNLNMDFDSVAAIKSMLGTGCITVMDETVSIPNALWNLMRFYSHESCGQCTPCREGCLWMTKLLKRINKGQGRPGDLDLLEDVADNIIAKTICPLSDAAVMPVQSYIKKFRSEFEDLIRRGKPSEDEWSLVRREIRPGHRYSTTK